jgi:hypothetical protein
MNIFFLLITRMVIFLCYLQFKSKMIFCLKKLHLFIKGPHLIFAPSLQKHGDGLVDKIRGISLKHIEGYCGIFKKATPKYRYLSFIQTVFYFWRKFLEKELHNSNSLLCFSHRHYNFKHILSEVVVCRSNFIFLFSLFHFIDK